MFSSVLTASFVLSFIFSFELNRFALFDPVSQSLSISKWDKVLWRKGVEVSPDGHHPYELLCWYARHYWITLYTGKFIHSNLANASKVDWLIFISCPQPTSIAWHSQTPASCNMRPSINQIQERTEWGKMFSPDNPIWSSFKRRRCVNYWFDWEKWRFNLRLLSWEFLVRPPWCIIPCNLKFQILLFLEGTLSVWFVFCSLNACNNCRLTLYIRHLVE